MLFNTIAFVALGIYGVYHIISATRSHLKHTSRGTTLSGDYTARPYYPLPLHSHRHHLLRHLPLYLGIITLSISIVHLSFSSSGAQRFPSLSSAAALLLLLILLPVAALSSNSAPPDLLFLLASVAFALLSSSSFRFASSFPPADLQSKSSSISAIISAASAAASLSLALSPKLFVSEFFLAASIFLKGLWFFVSGLFLYVETFIPEGCHSLIDLPDGPTRSSFSVLSLFPTLRFDDLKRSQFLKTRNIPSLSP
ncbi:hypothetical protein J5N97_007070 [Dioscorea zingiberensis]|uniref:Uncharacterized protein n=1 Tax=Dioscorea zingiberensis TaxID=325984 RepID=A0A9D5HTW0_9LILI|nr:hypothetical protein J5N97_007070 [Dioscorea zingiberensis]